MDGIKLPIDVVAGTDPPIFKWQQVVDTLTGRQVVDHEEALPATVEVAVARLISITKQVLMDNAGLQGQVKGHCDRIAAQSDLLSKRAEAQQPTPHKRGK